MSLVRVGLAIETILSEGCSKITVQDITGTYDVTTNPLGYGLPGGITYNDVTSVFIKVYYPDVSTPIIYTFTLSYGTITALDVTDLNGIVYDIYSELSTLVVANVFNLTGTTAFTLPTVTDGLFNVEYTIFGTEAVSLEQFNYTTNSNFLSTCSADCCITNMYKDLDMCCDCSEDQIVKIQNAETFLAGAKYAIEVGQNEKAICLLTKAKKICDSNCTDCN